MSTPDVQLLVRACCPHIELARQRLVEALRSRGLEQGSIRVVDMDSPGCPAVHRNLGSPTILIDGDDVADGATLNADGPTCRIYPGGNGAPKPEDIATALDSWLQREKDA